MTNIAVLETLARTNPDGLSEEGWQRLRQAGSLFAKAVSYPDTFLDDVGLRHPSGYLVSGPGSADVIRTALGRAGHMGSSALYACVRAYVRHYNMPPLRLWDGPTGDVEASTPIENNAVYRLLAEPHDDLTLSDLRALIRRCVLVEGNGYLLKLRNGGGTVFDNDRGQVVVLHPIDPTQIRPARDKGSSNLIDYYALNLGNGKIGRVPKANVIHFRDDLDSADPSRGIGAVKQIAREVASDAEADAFIQAVMRNLGIPGLIFAPKEAQRSSGVIDPEQLRSYVAASTSGENRGKPLVFKAPVDFYQMSANTRVLNLSHVSARVETRIASAIGIPAILAGLQAGLDSTSYGANTRALVEGFVEGVLFSAWQQDGERWTLGLRADFGLGPGQWLGYDWTGLRALAEDEHAKAKDVLEQWNANAITIGQFHLALDMELPVGVDPDARKVDIEGGRAGPAIVDGGALEPLALPAPSGVDMSAARLDVLQRVAERVANGSLAETAAIQQIVFGFGVDEATARRLIGAAVDAVEDGGALKTMLPFASKADTWTPPSGEFLTGRQLVADFDAEEIAEDAVADWADWLEGSDDAEFAELLDVAPAETGREDEGKTTAIETKDRAPAYAWNWDVAKQRFRYINKNRLVTKERVKGLRERRIDESRKRMRDATQKLIDGKMTLRQWQKAMRDESALGHLQARMLAVGGKENMTRADYKWVNERIARESRYLAQFANDIRDGRHSPAGILNRASMYAGASMRDAYYSGATESHAAAGYKEKARVGPNDETTCDDCRKEIQQGYVAIDKNGWVVGETECQSQDRCDITFR